MFWLSLICCVVVYLGIGLLVGLTARGLTDEDAPLAWFDSRPRRCLLVVLVTALWLPIGIGLFVYHMAKD